MKHTSTYLFLIFLFTINNFLKSQTINYIANYAAMPSDLSIREVHDIYQDQNGYIWASLRTKLFRYDGYSFADFSDIRFPGGTLLASNNLSSSNYSLLKKLNEKYFYVHYKEDPSILDLIHIDSLNLRTIHLGQYFPGAKVLSSIAIPESDNVAVFCQKNNSLIYYEFSPLSMQWTDRGSFQLSQISKPLENISCALTPDGTAYFSASFLPIICFNRIDHKVSPIEIPFAVNDFTLLSSFKDQALFFTGNVQSTLYRYDLKNQTVLSYYQKDFKGKINYMAIDTLGNIILASEQQQYFRNIILIPSDGTASFRLTDILNAETKITQIKGENFLKQILVSSINGIYIFINKKKQFSALLNKEIKHGAFGHVIRGMAEDSERNLFIAEDGNSLYKMNLNADSILKTYNTSVNNLPTPGTIKLIGNNLWGIRSVETDLKQIYNLNIVTEKFSYYNLPLRTFRIRDFEILDSNKLICFGYDSKVDTLMVQTFDILKNAWQSIYCSTTLKKPTDILLDKFQRIWIGSETGLYVYYLGTGEIKKLNHETSDRALDNKFTVSLNFVQNSDLLLVGSEAGLFTLDTKTLKYIDHFTKDKNGISHNYIEGILPINDKEVLLTTRSGISHLDLGAGKSVNFYQNDGLAQNEFNRFSVFKSSNDKYFFGGVNGLSFISKNDLTKYVLKDAISISRFFRFDYKLGIEKNYSSNLNIINQVTIEPDDQYFGFEFMSSDFYQPELNQFQIWLEGYDKSWQLLPTNHHHIKYGRLPRGNYKFHLRAFPNQGKEKVISIQVKGHFYQSAWFIPGISFILLLVSIALALYFINKKRIKELEIQKTEQKFKDLEAAALRAQMNPHFIFNCLGSIQNFISQHDNESATKYLANFSRLIRLALHSSVDGKHSLQDEIEMLDNYLGLERLRFGDKFTFEIEVDPGLDKEDIYFPPLLIQPFVENALVHGMKNKKEGGKIIVTFKQNEEGLQATVSDNGPGFSVETRSLNSSGHKSVGMTLTKSRLEILSGKETFSISPVIGDDGKPNGTKVDILIPIL